ncbi:MAG: hypothetical protein INR73_15100 [Williamsia sp.]|nr:hypothetical protein [Williamsia sp.]
MTFFCFYSAAFSQAFPQHNITNGLVTATLYLPDSGSGYYRGTRFDWSGVIKSLSYKGHSYFGQWNKRYDPKLHDAIMGPVEEFEPIGYDDAKADAPFLKIGVGVLRRLNEKPYSFSTLYPVLQPGTWSVKTEADGIRFTHVLQDAEGWSYIYTKTVRLTKGKPELVLEHSLKNTGTRTLDTRVYDHNFFIIDSQRTGPAIRTSFPFALNDNGTGRGLDTIGKISDKQISYLRNVEDRESMYIGSLTGFSDDAKDYDIRIENLRAGAGVRIRCDQPLKRLVFWSCATTSCPEPYIHIKAEPGQTFKWKIAYQFYEMARQ